MYLTIKAQLKPNKRCESDLLDYEHLFKKEIFKICAVFKKKNSTFEYRYKNISNDISWYCKSIVLSKAKEMYYANKNGKLMDMNFSSLWNVNSFDIDISLHNISLILGRNQLQRRVIIPIYWTAYLENRFRNGKILSLILSKNKDDWIAYFQMKYEPANKDSNKEMGIDIGIKVPAVVCTSDMKVKFFGNGRLLRYNQQRYRSKYKKLQQLKDYKKMKHMNHKLHHILNDFDHKISSQIIKFAIKEDIGLIKLEKLKNINTSFNIKISSNIYLWSYNRLQEMIIYKANLNGIRITFVDPKNTSKTCPKCGSLNIPKDRKYICKICDYMHHRDVVGAINILRAL